MTTAALPKEAELVATVYARAKLAEETLPDFGEFVFGWPCEGHHMRWARALDDKRIKRLVMIGPPSSAKTTWNGVVYVARQVGRDPSTHIAYITYNDEVAQSRSVAIRDTVLTPEFQLVFPGAKRDKGKGWGEKEWFLKRPNRGDPDPTLRAASLFGAYLAYHFDEVVLDDPHDPDDVVSKAMREKAWRRLEEVLFPRLRPEARMVVTGFRWAEDDVPGRCMEQGWHADDECNGKCEDRSAQGGDPPSEWHVVHIMATVEEEDEDGGTVEVSYWEEEWPIKKLQGIKVEIGASTYACQYQGLPAPEEGHIFKWFYEYDEIPMKNIIGVAIGLDTAYTKEERSDYTAWAAWLYDDKPKPWKYLVDGGQIKEEMPEAEKYAGMFALKMQRQYPHLPVRVLVRQRVAIDRVAAQHLRAQGINAVGVPMPSGGGDIKQAIARLIAPEFEARRMLLPKNAGPWFDVWRHQHQMFPGGAHDDFVETTLVVGKRLAGTKVGVRRTPMRRRG